MAQTVAAKPRAEQKARTRERILEAARALLSGPEDGAYTARGVAERAGVSPGLVIQHFDSLADLALEIFLDANEELYANIAAASRAPGDALERVVACFRAILARDLARRALTARVMAFAWTWTPAHEARLQDHLRARVDLLVDLVDEHERRSSSSDRLAIAGALYTVYNGFLRVAVTAGQDVEETLARMRPCLALIVAGHRCVTCGAAQ